MESVPSRQSRFVGLTSLTLSCAAKAHVPKFAWRDGCYVRAATRRERMSAGVPPATLGSQTEGLQPRPEAGPHQLQREVSQPTRAQVTTATRLTGGSLAVALLAIVKLGIGRSQLYALVRRFYAHDFSCHNNSSRD